MNVIIERFAYTPTETEGRLLVAGQVFWTLERPWIQVEDDGGKPFKSCIPDGIYKLIPYQRGNGDDVLAYVNQALGVYFKKADRPGDAGRYKCLWHPANYTEQVVGCTAIGNLRKIYQGKRMVSNSRKTFETLRELINFNETHTVEIRQAAGATDA